MSLNIDYDELDALIATNPSPTKFDIHTYVNKAEYVEPTPLKISTITAIAILSSGINLEIVSTSLEINQYIQYVEFGNHPKRGKQLKKISKKKASKKKMFFNQATVIVNISPYKYVNTKLFANGKIQMTGLKDPEDGRKAIQILIGEIKRTFAIIDGENVCAAKNPEHLELDELRIVLINTDFKANFKIRRPILHKILINRYGLFAKYEPCIYPGVDTKFYWNTDYDRDGICHCTQKCTGKGYGKGNGDCKKVTIASFQSGSVIITGARTMQQVRDAYSFINNIFKIHFDEIKKVIPAFIQEEEQNPKKEKCFYIKKEDIKDRLIPSSVINY